MKAVNFENMENMNVELQKLCFETLDSGDPCLDALYFIKQMMNQTNMTRKEKEKVLTYLLNEVLEDTTPNNPG